MIPSNLLPAISKANIPISAMFELTWRCNLKCIHCFQLEPGIEELSEKEVKNILDQLAEAGCLYLTLTGGEPLLREDFFEIAEYASKKNFCLTLYTNGTLLTPEIADKIAELNFLYVQISLHGVDSSTHDKISGVNGSFERVKKAISLLKEKKIPLGLATTMMRPNFHQLKEIQEFHKQAESESRMSPVIYPKNNGDTTPLLLNLDSNELLEFYSFIIKQNHQTNEKIDFVNGLYCSYGKTGCSVSAKGELYPCVALPVSLGNLKEEKFSSIWQNNSFLKWIREKSATDLYDCKDCPDNNYCCRCSALSWWEKNDLLGSSSQCCEQAKILKEVIENESGKKEIKLRKTQNEGAKDHCSLF